MSSHCELMYTRYLQCIAISLALLLSLVQRLSLHGRGRTDPWLCLDRIKDIVLDASLTFTTIKRSTIQYSVSSNSAISALLFLPSTHTSCVWTGTHSSSPYLLLGNVSEPVSLSVRIVMRPIFHVGRYFIAYYISCSCESTLWLQPTLMSIKMLKSFFQENQKGVFLWRCLFKVSSGRESEGLLACISYAHRDYWASGNEPI